MNIKLRFAKYMKDLLAGLIICLLIGIFAGIYTNNRREKIEDNINRQLEIINDVGKNSNEKNLAKKRIEEILTDYKKQVNNQYIKLDIKDNKAYILFDESLNIKEISHMGFNILILFIIYLSISIYEKIVRRNQQKLSEEKDIKIRLINTSFSYIFFIIFFMAIIFYLFNLIKISFQAFIA